MVGSTEDGISGKRWYILVGMSLIGPIGAQTDFSTQDAYLATMDLDGDGRIALSEFRDHMSRRFREMDADGDGTLRGSELPVPGNREIRLRDYLDALAAQFKRQDGNDDGHLSLAELTAPPR